MKHGDDIFSADFKEQPFWWDAAPRPSGNAATIAGASRCGDRRLRPHRPVGGADAGARRPFRRGVRQRTIPAKAPAPAMPAMSAAPSSTAFARSWSMKGWNAQRRVFRDMRAAFDHVFELVQSEQIDCKMRQRGRFIAAQNQAQYDSIAARIRAARKASRRAVRDGGAGAPVRRNRRAGIFRRRGHPRSRGLSSRPLSSGICSIAWSRAGVEIHGRTPVTRLPAATGDDLVVTTEPWRRARPRRHRGHQRLRRQVPALVSPAAGAVPWLHDRDGTIAARDDRIASRRCAGRSSSTRTTSSSCGRRRTRRASCSADSPAGRSPT